MAPIHAELNELFDVPKIGINPGHEACVEEIKAAQKELKFNDWEGNPTKSRGKSTTRGSRRTSHTGFTITDNMFKRKDSKDPNGYAVETAPKMSRVVKHSQVIPAEKDRYTSKTLHYIYSLPSPLPIIVIFSVLIPTLSKKVDTHQNENFSWID